MISVLVFAFVLGVLILVHEAGHFFMARKVGVRVERFSLGFGPKLFSFKCKETEYLICAIPFGGYVKMAGDERSEFHKKPDEYLFKRPFDRFKILFAGAFLNYCFAFIVFYVVFLFGFPVGEAKVGGLLHDYPAQKAGLEIDDRITAVDDVKVENWDEMAEEISKKLEVDVDLEVLRGEQKLNLTLTPEVKEVTDIFGKTEKVGRIGIIPSADIIFVKHGWKESFKLALERQIYLTHTTYKAIWYMITGQMSFKETVSGPIAIFKVTSVAATFGLMALLHVMAVVSLSLAIFNLLPFPVLDGGHILLLGIEAVRKKPLPVKVEDMINRIGLTFLLVLVVFVMLNDAQRFGYIQKIIDFFK